MKWIMYQLFHYIHHQHQASIMYEKLFIHTLFLSSPFSPFLLPPSCLCLFFSITNTLTFMQNLGLVCLQSITLILEDDFNKQVTLSRGGQILTSPNHGFTLNGKKQRCACISTDSKHNLNGPFSSCSLTKHLLGTCVVLPKILEAIIFAIFLKWPRVCTSKQILEIKGDRGLGFAQAIGFSK